MAHCISIRQHWSKSVYGCLAVFSGCWDKLQRICFFFAKTYLNIFTYFHELVLSFKDVPFQIN